MGRRALAAAAGGLGDGRRHGHDGGRARAEATCRSCRGAGVGSGIPEEDRRPPASPPASAPPAHLRRRGPPPHLRFCSRRGDLERRRAAAASLVRIRSSTEELLRPASAPPPAWRSGAARSGSVAIATTPLLPPSFTSDAREERPAHRRPRQVKDVAHQEEVVRVLTNTLQTAELPHMLFYGPPGTGKTTTALAIAYQLYGPELYKSRVLELNASDDRGINVVRTKIKDFAAVAVGTARKAGYPCPPYKIIILDEADSMTEDAQNALRRTMETYSKVTRFFFICNYMSRIIEPLASRCAKFRFKPLSEEVMSSRIMHICNDEGLNLDSQVLSTLSTISQGDLRRAITYLQSAARLFGSSISSTDLISVSGVIPEDVVKSLLAACRSGEFDVANKEVSNIITDGYPVSQLMAQFLDVIVSADDIPDEQKARICKKFGETDKCLVDGADEYLQLLDVASETIRALFNMPQTLVF